MGDNQGLTHLSEEGEARMVDVSGKAVTEREAIAEALVVMPPDVLERLMTGKIPKGDVAAVARIAGIMAAKKTSDLIPLCHPIPLDAIEVTIEPVGHGVRVVATVRTTGRTGVEMEAMTAVSVAALTVYDMVKSLAREVSVEGVRLLRKTGGRSGTWERS